MRMKRLQMLGLLPKNPEAEEQTKAEDINTINGDGASAVANEEPASATNEIKVNNEPLVVSEPNANSVPSAGTVSMASNELKAVKDSSPGPISFTFNIYPTDKAATAKVISSLAKTLADLCLMDDGAETASLKTNPIVSVNKPVKHQGESKDDSWLSDFEKPANKNQSTPRCASEDDLVVVIPSDNSMYSDDGGAYGAGASLPRTATLNTTFKPFQPARDASVAGPSSATSFSMAGPGPSQSTGAIRKSSAGSFAMAGPGPSQSTGAVRKSSAPAPKVYTSSSDSDQNIPYKRSKDKNEKGNFMSQMAAFFKNHAPSKSNKDKTSGGKHFLSDSSETSQEVMPKKKVRTADPPQTCSGAQAQAPAGPVLPPDEDPHLGLCSICLSNPKNCKIRCRHVFCEPCLVKLKAAKKGCPFEGFRFRTWEKLF
ncbi:hypothetical protein FOCC_FOCC013234 [Frankliniella occidentalis]|nr:hypothetical protein FOCC_FOCC013234 [Frankliniella occidentalis]